MAEDGLGLSAGLPYFKKCNIMNFSDANRDIDSILHRPLIPLWVVYMSGLVTGAHFPGHMRLAGVLMGITAGSIIWCTFRKNPTVLSPLVCFGAIGYMAIQFWVAPRMPENHVSRFLEAGQYVITGTISSRPMPHRFGTRVILDTQAIEDHSKTLPITGKIRVTVTGDSEMLPPTGSVIRFPGRIRSIHGFQNPGGFDYNRYMGFKRIKGTARVRAEQVVVVRAPPRKWVGKYVDRFRAKLVETIDAKAEIAAGAVLKTLILGDRNGIPHSLRDSFNRVGISHILAISGLHVGMIGTLSFFIFRWCLSRIPFFLWHAWTRKGAALLSILPVLFYGVLAGMSPSTQRAVIMVTVFLMTFVLERDHDLLNTLALSGLIIVILFPPSVFSISFQLSFSAVLAIVCGMSRLSVPRPAFSHTLVRRGRRWMADLFKVSLLAYLGTLPLVLHYFNQISLVGPIANCFFVPFFGMVVVPLGLLAVFLFPVVPAVSSFLIDINLSLIELLLIPVTKTAALPFAAVRTITPDWIEICCYYGLLALLLSGMAGRPKAGDDPSEAHFLKKRWLKSLAIGLILLFSLDSGYWLYQRYFNPDLRVTLIDVGQGSAVLLELPGGETMLVDGGGFSDNSTFDIGARVVAPLLWRKKIATIDTVVLTHPNSDHLNGLLFILEHFHVKAVWSNGEPAETEGYRRFREIIEKQGIAMIRFQRLKRNLFLNDVQLKILNPPVEFLSKRQQEPWRNFNNNSLVIKVELGSVSFLLTGDIESDAEIEMVSSAGNELGSSVLAVPHHGSRTSGTLRFLSRVSPKIAVISAGWKNRYGFPHPDVMDRLKKTGCRIYRTDRDGAVVFRTDGHRLDVITAASDKIETFWFFR